jgi:hypothetical protein
MALEISSTGRNQFDDTPDSMGYSFVGYALEYRCLVGSLIMTSDFAAFEPRQPRHVATAPDRLCVEVEPRSIPKSEPFRAQLVDLSRQGLQLRIPVPLAVHENVSVRIRDDDSGLSISVSGEVRWQRPAEDGHWFVGCRCQQELNWETMGELFLHELLAMD